LKFVCIDEPHWRSTVVPGLLVDLRDAAPLHILDLGRVDTVPRDERVDDLRRRLVTPNVRQRAVLLSDRTTNGIDDHCLAALHT
jgi:hypothetical protein